MGSEEYSSDRELDYSCTEICLICYSVDDPSSFARIQSKWVPESKRFRGNDAPFLVVGLKTDLRDVKRIFQGKGKRTWCFKVCGMFFKERERSGQSY